MERLGAPPSLTGKGTMWGARAIGATVLLEEEGEAVVGPRKVNGVHGDPGAHALLAVTLEASYGPESAHRDSAVDLLRRARAVMEPTVE